MGRFPTNRQPVQNPHWGVRGTTVSHTTTTTLTDVEYDTLHRALRAYERNVKADGDDTLHLYTLGVVRKIREKLGLPDSEIS